MSAIALSATAAAARDQIRIVGSLTVFPYTQAVAEEFSNETGAPAPIVESTGTGGGMQIFCGGVGEDTPPDQRPARDDPVGIRPVGAERRDRNHRGHDRL